MEFYIKKDAPLRPHDKHWQFCVGSCHAPLAHRVDYLEQLKFVHDELGIKRVRFHGIFNDDMKVGMTLRNVIPLKRANKFQEFSFYQISKVYDNILKTGMRPFVELGFMPKILASGKRQCSFEYKGNITMPKSLEKWGEFIKEFVTFLIDRYGQDEVSEWYFEVWNEPNLPAFFAGSKDDYFKLYEVTARAIKSVCEKIQVGGPSTANCGWVDDFVQFVRKNDVPCDFVSTHQYAGDSLGHVIDYKAVIKSVIANLKVMRKSKGGSVLEGARIMFTDESEGFPNRNIFADNARRMKKEADGLPLFYTEWNVSATCTAKINDTRRAASYTVRTVLAAEGIADKTSLWCFSDIFEEIQFFPDPFSGAFGMLNIHGIPKPLFYGFKILSMLGDLRYDIKNEDNAAIEAAAFKKGEMLQVLLLKQNFIAESGKKDEVTLSVEADEAPKAVRMFRIDDEHCNPFAVWEAMGKPKYLKPAEVEKIKSESALTAEDVPFEYVDGKVVVRTALANNDIQLFEVE